MPHAKRSAEGPRERAHITLEPVVLEACNHFAMKEDRSLSSVINLLLRRYFTEIGYINEESSNA